MPKGPPYLEGASPPPPNQSSEYGTDPAQNLRNVAVPPPIIKQKRMVSRPAVFFIVFAALVAGAAIGFGIATFMK